VGMLDAAARVSTVQNEEKLAQYVRDLTPAQAARLLSTYRRLKPL